MGQRNWPNKAAISSVPTVRCAGEFTPSTQSSLLFQKTRKSSGSYLDVCPQLQRSLISRATQKLKLGAARPLCRTDSSIELTLPSRSVGMGDSSKRQSDRFRMKKSSRVGPAAQQRPVGIIGKNRLLVSLPHRDRLRSRRSSDAWA